MTVELFPDGTAELSADGRYRYVLTRRLTDVAFVMLNPSTADADRDDQTIRRCKHFARRLGADRLTVVNLYAYRATEPRDLARVDDPVGPDNDYWIERVGRSTGWAVAAWGADPAATPARIRRVLALLGRPLFCLGTTVSGAPRHPSRLPDDAPFDFPWEPPDR